MKRSELLRFLLRDDRFWRRLARLSIPVALLTALAVVAAAQSLTVGKADPVRYLNDIKALTTPAMEGRGDDTKGIELATNMLEDRYKSLGLLPAGTAGFRQPFSVITGAKLARQQQHSRANRQRHKRTQAQRPFCPLQLFLRGPGRRARRFCGLWRHGR